MAQLYVSVSPAIAVLFSLRANPVSRMSTLISAEVNQLTLLVGSMMVVFSLSGEPLSFLLDQRRPSCRSRNSVRLGHRPSDPLRAHIRVA